MAGRNTNKNKKATAISLAAVLLIALISVFASLDLFSPEKWDDVYSKAGLSDAANADNDEKLAFSVHFIDVGQGDSTLIKANGHTMLIDAGEPDYGETVAAYLKKNNVKTLDYLVATHPHADHIGGIPKAIEGITVKNVIMPKLTQENTPTTKVYENFLRAVADSNAAVIEAVPGSEYMLGDAKFTVLSPSVQSDELNDMSVVIKLKYFDNTFLFMGDAEFAAENIMLEKGYDLSADVLKIGHHGSKYSTGDAFLNAVGPSVAVISCGLNNSYGHPGNTTISKLESRGIDYKRTDKNGTVVIESDKKHITVSTEK